MAGLGIDYEADHAEIEQDRGVTVFFRGRTIPALVSIPEHSRDFEDDATGFYRTAILRATIRMSQIPNYNFSPIKEGDTLRYGKDTFRVANVTPDEVSRSVLLDLESEAQ